MRGSMGRNVRRSACEDGRSESDVGMRDARLECRREYGRLPEPRRKAGERGAPLDPAEQRRLEDERGTPLVLEQHVKSGGDRHALEACAIGCRLL